MDIRANRTRTRSLLVRLNESERRMLDEVTAALDLPSASEAFRFLVRKAHADHVSAAAGAKKSAGRRARRELVLLERAGDVAEDVDGFAEGIADFVVGLMRKDRARRGLPPLPEGGEPKKARARRKSKKR